MNPKFLRRFWRRLLWTSRGGSLRVIPLFLVAFANNCWGDQTESQLAPNPPAAAVSRVDFVTEIQPIFQRACLACHGGAKQKGDYRLDVRETAFKGGESYAPNIVRGKSDQSPLIRLVTGIDELVMPPAGERLSDAEISLLRNWIDQGADWPDHVAGKANDKSDLWSLKPLALPEVPGGPPSRQDSNPAEIIDRFVRQKRDELHFTGSAEADRRTLLRRVSFDLIGLPPTPEEVDTFLADPNPHAYEKWVDQLLDSPRYGERWARHWLDTAHYAETHGHDQDRIREHAWPYRDYLIESFNSDKPYSRFVQEQIAGDVLFPEHPAATVALGFLAAGPWDESSLRDIREDTVDRQIARYLDRDDMVSTVMNNICSLTVQCARCHDHKFDPISQQDYYALQAVFSGVERANRRYDADAGTARLRQDLLRRKQALEQRTAEETARLMSAAVQRQVAEWEDLRGRQTAVWQNFKIDSFTSADGATLSMLPDGSILSNGPCPEKETVTIVSAPFSSFNRSSQEKSSQEKLPAEKPPADEKDHEPHPEPQHASKPTTLRQITAIRLEVLTHESLPKNGPGRQPDNGNLHLTEFEVWIDGCDKPLELVNATADFDQSGWDIAKSIDRNEETAWGIHPQEGAAQPAVFELKTPLRLHSAGFEATCLPTSPHEKSRENTGLHHPDRLRIVLKQRHGRQHIIGRLRLAWTDSALPVRIEQTPGPLAAILTIPPLKRTEAQRQELAAFQQLNEINQALAVLPASKLVYAAAADFEPDGSLRPPPGPRPIHVLHRGDIRHPREEVLPGALSCVTAIPARFEIPSGMPESLRRKELAQWLTDQDNPLTWRSIVNRVWYHHFGRGIVGTLNDFGQTGEKPTHPELLDWLALEFRDSGQSMKSLHRWIVTSQTYRQKVETPRVSVALSTAPGTIQDQRVGLDADNRWLWRMNRIRLDGESIRDSVLAISGRLDLRMGGPSDRQFDLQPGIHVTPRVDYGKFDPLSELGRRRSIYRFLFRTLPDPFMESLDCPSGDQITPARNNSVTVQQALALWNDVFIAQNCEQIALRIEGEVNPSQIVDSDKSKTDKQIERAFRLILGRNPAETEIDEVRIFTAEHGLANLCRLLLNSNEFLFVN